MSKGFKNYALFDEELKARNVKLKAAGLPVIRRIGNTLFARTTCPPRPDSKSSCPSQQDIRLNLPAELGSLKAAQQKVKKIAGELASKSFEWYDYLPATKVAKLKAEAEKRSNPRFDWKVVNWVELFTERYFQRRKRTATTEQSLKTHYLDYFKKLPQHVLLTLEVLERTIRTKTEADSYTRHDVCFAFKTLAKFVGLDTESIHELRGAYCSTKPAPRDLPSDALIVEWFDRIPNPNWQWVFGMMAAYGLRPHETFHVDSSELEQGGYAIYVSDNTKTGRRRVMPLHTQWIERFRLREKRLPKITGKTNKVIGQKISQALRVRYKIPFLLTTCDTHMRCVGCWFQRSKTRWSPVGWGIPLQSTRKCINYGSLKQMSVRYSSSMCLEKLVEVAFTSCFC